MRTEAITEGSRHELIAIFVVVILTCMVPKILEYIFFRTKKYLCFRLPDYFGPIFSNFVPF